MGSILDHISTFGHGVAAILFGALAIWQFQRRVERNQQQVWLVIAISLTRVLVADFPLHRDLAKFRLAGVHVHAVAGRKRSG